MNIPKALMGEFSCMTSTGLCVTLSLFCVIILTQYEMLCGTIAGVIGGLSEEVGKTREVSKKPEGISGNTMDRQLEEECAPSVHVTTS